jgi:hypothetical protein
MYGYDSKIVSSLQRRERSEKGELRNAGYSHDVIENTCRKNVSLGYSHDIHENKRLKSA